MSEVYKFKAMSQVETQEAPTDTTTVLAVENGAVKQIPAGKFGGGGAAGFTVTLTMNPYGMEIISADKTFAEIVTAVEAGAYPVAKLYMSADGYVAFAYLPINQVAPDEVAVFKGKLGGEEMMVACQPDDTWQILRTEGEEA